MNSDAADEIKQIVNNAIESEKTLLQSLSQFLWNQPELGFEEVLAHKHLTDVLEEKGFDVQREYHLPTAFRAEYGSIKDGGKTVCIICEYDALPEIGHACGHNLISESGIGAGLAIKEFLDKKQIPGKVVILGTPAEEGGGGKVILINAGALKDIDFALMVHPGPAHLMKPNLLAVIRIVINYHGKEAHAALAPWEGLNALDAAVACYSNIALLRQQMRPTWRVHGVINKGGTQPNIIPGETQLTYYLRAPDMKELETLKSAAVRCFEGAARATSCTVKYQFLENGYHSFLYIDQLQNLYKQFAESYGVEFTDGKDDFTGSTDMGNVSQVVPSIHPIFKIKTSGANHTKEFNSAAGSPESQEPTLIAAKCLALTAIELFSNKILQETVTFAFKSRKGK